jgi:hypothetical protein
MELPSSQLSTPLCRQLLISLAVIVAVEPTRASTPLRAQLRKTQSLAVNEALATISAPLLMPDEKEVFEEAEQGADEAVTKAGPLRD